jgi:class 3 adenylate cyclase
MEPRIQYAKTADGVSIAFWTLGERMPFVHMPTIPFSHIRTEWQVSEVRQYYERLAQNVKLVRYDGRGTGLSEREVADVSLHAHVLDLEAVVDRLDLERFAVLAVQHAGPPAIAYTALHPERVSHLVLWASFARASDLLRSPRAQGLWALAKKDWELFTETAAQVMFGWSAGEPARQYAAFMREGVTQKVARVLLSSETDVTALLPRVKVPTLVVQRRRLAFPELSVARDLASRIPDARLVILEGASYDMEAWLEVIDEFLGEGEKTGAGAEPPAAGAFRTVVFTDVEGSTSLTQRLGDEKGRAVLREHERITREALLAHGGTEVKTMGDGFMASFSSATRALECAIAMQRAFAEHNESAEEPIRVRIGLNAGEPIAEEEDLFGTAVILAARIAAKAEGGEILASDVVRQLVAGKGFLFADRGETVVRGFEDPVRLYEVRWREEA